MASRIAPGCRSLVTVRDPEPSPEYVAARRVLLDALEALGPQSAALVLAGAQAIYVRTGPASLATARPTGPILRPITRPSATEACRDRESLDPW